ncbi:MAG: FAD-dependent oxidoreductase, partial [Bacteroidota bacterium]
MHQRTEAYDFAIFGGGLFGSYAALFLSQKGLKVALIEKEKNLFTKASIVNQARLHGGYHYPRSVATARMSDDNKARFTAEHRSFINFTYDKYYAIDRYGSLTDATQFQRFCDYLNIPCQSVDTHPHISLRRLEALFLTEEYTFDPILIAQYYQARVKDADLIDVRLATVVEQVEIKGSRWKLNYRNLDGQKGTILAGQVVNATYTASNAVNQLFGLPNIELMHEISEMVLLSAPDLKELGLTVMDGQFASLMPYGKSGLLSLSSVAYTHHSVSYDAQPTFACQKDRLECKPNLPEDCNYC